ncbi:MAG: hypothetical protein JRJ59_09955, partial [Deltaproteobacteria bacterium]|nr:hypothetical protein [Deltaproteobacteria bacterium]
MSKARLLGLGLGVFCLAIFSQGAGAQTAELARLPLDDLRSLGTVIALDPSGPAQGRAAVKVESPGP